MAEIWQAEDKDHALPAVKAFEVAYGPKWPKATAIRERIAGIQNEADQQTTPM